jgi:regulator of sigma E protease
MQNMPQFILHLLGTLEYAFAIITLLGGVIAVHEFGHFLFAKWAGIRVDTFSIGFGPSLFTRTWGETEYCLKLVPVGGFVKIYGQDPDELVQDPKPQPNRSFSNKSLPQKISVLFGGPLFNYLLAILIFSFLAIVGVQKLPSVATRVVAETPAYKAGLRSGDAILAVDGQETRTFDELLDLIAKHPNKKVHFKMTREGQPLELDVQLQKEHALTPYGEESEAGLLDGIDPFGREAEIATTLPQHPWGFRTGDKITEFEGHPVASWEDFEKKLAAALLANANPLHFKILRGKESLAVQSGDIPSLLSKMGGRKDVFDFLDLAGIFNSELFIQEVMKDAPAYVAGLKAGDRVISLNGQRVFSFDYLRTLIQNTGEAAAKAGKTANKNGDIENVVQIELERAGQKQTIQSGVHATKGKDPLGATIVTYTIGILSSGKPQMPANLLLERTFNPFKAVYLGAKETTEHTVMTVVGLKKVLFGEVSAKTMGGPIMIGKLAGDTLSTRGWRDFLRIMAIISISLGVFNLIPLPILDGGHIVFAVIESIRGRPLSQRVQQTALRVGLSLILLLMVFALYNDISRVVPLPF